MRFWLYMNSCCTEQFAISKVGMEMSALLISQRLSLFLEPFKQLEDWRYGCIISLVALCCIAFILWLREHLSSSGFTTQQWKALLDLTKTAYLPKHKSMVMSVLDKRDIDVNGYRDPTTGLNLLLCACLSGQLDLVTALIDRGADCKSLTQSGLSALVLATYACSTVRGADPKLIDLLACRGVDVNKGEEGGFTALSTAALFGRTKIISMLLEYGASCKVCGSGAVQPLDLAGDSGNLSAAKLLEDHMTRSY